MEELKDVTDMELENIVLSKTTSAVKLAVLVQDKIANLNAHVLELESSRVSAKSVLCRIETLEKGQQDMAEKVEGHINTPLFSGKGGISDIVKRLEALEIFQHGSPDPTPAKCGTCGDTGIKVIGGDVGTMDCPDCQPQPGETWLLKVLVTGKEGALKGTLEIEVPQAEGLGNWWASVNPADLRKMEEV